MVIKYSLTRTGRNDLSAIVKFHHYHMCVLISYFNVMHNVSNNSRINKDLFIDKKKNRKLAYLWPSLPLNAKNCYGLFEVLWKGLAAGCHSKKVKHFKLGHFLRCVFAMSAIDPVDMAWINRIIIIQQYDSI